MVSTFTPNINLEEPARGDYVGTWDTPVNSNMTLLDLVAGGQTTISGAAGSVVLSAAQFQCKTITFNSTLLASITVTFPTSFMKSYEIFNTCTGSSAFVITLQTTAAGAGFVCAPPGEIVEIVNIGGQIRFKNLGRVGSYWDDCGSSVPAWVSGSNPVPYLLCDGSAFSSASYPQLATKLGSTTLPDARGRARFALDGGTGRISSAATGFSGSSVGSFGGQQTITLGTSNLPPYTPSGTITSSLVSVGGNLVSDPGTGGPASHINAPVITSLSFTGNAQGGVSQPITDLPPAYIGGITMIRAG